MHTPFVHLRVHTEYSLVDGLLRIDPLMDILPQYGMSAIAITDYCNLFAVVKVYQTALAAGIKPIIGCDIPCFYDEKASQINSMVLLCQSELGYRNLTRLVSRSYQEGQTQGSPRVNYDWISAYNDDLIALSGGLQGDIGRALLAGDYALAVKRAKHWSRIFPNRFYLEIQRTNRPDEELYNEAVVRLANDLTLPLVATNDVRFLLENDFEAHEARVCIHEGIVLADTRRKHAYSPKQYLRTADEMAHLFADLPQALENTVEIMKRCNLVLHFGQNYLPDFPTPNNLSMEAYLSQLATAGLNHRLENTTVIDPIYEQRLKSELDVINKMGFAGYFLIVADFIKWAKDNKIPVGPGRGSGAGSLVAYALNITDLDPLQYDLLFERFLNPERVSMPDFDIDFCMDGRDRVIDYVAEKYGRQSVSQIITFGTMAAKAVVRDVGRVLGHPYSFVDKLAKLIPFEIGITLKAAMEQEPLLRQQYQDEEEVKELIDLALKLEGITRNAGKHAGGVVIAPSELTDFTAIYCEQNSTQIVSQFDKDDVEAVGLVKFDFLGLRTLTIIDWTLTIINQNRIDNKQTLIDINHIPMQDPLSFTLLKGCQTTAVFQLESRGMKEIIKRLQPDCFEDIIALVALFRPGPLQSGMVDDFIDRKHGRAAVEYMHPDLEPILKPTYGVILYQEQVMQIAQVLANYTLGAADLLRRAMGKKKPEEMAKQRAIFIEGAKNRAVSEDTATAIFDLMEKFAGYGFNKSHSAAYALLAYQTAWLKAHYPAAFMAAVISSDMDNTDKVVNLLQECATMSLSVLPPSINQAQYYFTVSDGQNLVYGLGAIKGVGEAAIDAIVQERNQSGIYTGLFNFCQRLDLRKVNRRVLEALIKSGSFDEWGIDRGVLFVSLDKAMQCGAQFTSNKLSGQTNLLNLLEDDVPQEAYLTGSHWSIKQRLLGEKETLGYYLSGHPAHYYHQELKHLVKTVAELNPSLYKKALLCGIVKSTRQVVTKRGKTLIIVNLEDATGNQDIVVFSERTDTKLLNNLIGEIAVVEGELSRDDYSGGIKLIANAIYSIDETRTKFASRLSIHLNHTQVSLLSTLQSILSTHPGDCVVRVEYSNDAAKVGLNLGRNWCINPTDELLAKLSELLGEEHVLMCY